MKRIGIRTKKRIEMLDITGDVERAMKESGIVNGLLFVYTPHTTAAVTINENADPAVPKDIIDKLNQLVPESKEYRHLEGNADSHIKSSIIGASETLIVENSSLVLGTWQSIFFCEFDGPRSRNVFIQIIPEG